MAYIRVNSTELYIEETPPDRITVAQAALYIEEVPPDRVRVDQVLVYVEVEDGPTLIVNSGLAYVEETPDADLVVVSALVYVEEDVTKYAQVESAGVYVEETPDETVTVESLGVYVEEEVGVTPPQTITPDLVESTPAVYDPTIVVGTITVVPDLVESASAVYDPTLALGTLTVIPDPVESAPTVPDPTLLLGSITIVPDLVESTPEVFDPTIVQRNRHIIPDLVESTPTVPDPTIVLGPLTIVPDPVVSPSDVYDPSLSTLEVHVSEVRQLVEEEATRQWQVSKLTAQLEAEDVGALVAQFGAYVEYQGIGLYVTKFGALVEFEEETVPVYFPLPRGTRRIHYKLPDEVTGYAFDPERSWWATIIPQESENLVRNPSFENDIGLGALTAPTGYLMHASWTGGDINTYTAPGATHGRTSYKLTHGNVADDLWFAYGESPDYALHVSPGYYSFSLDVYVATQGTTVRLAVVDGDLASPPVTPVVQQTSYFDETGWRRMELSYYEAGTGNRQIVFYSTADNNGMGAIFYVDGWQFERSQHPTTYIDGDKVGWNDVQPQQSYFWRGTPHDSTSIRRKTTGSGGRIVSWDDTIEFLTTGIVGLGMSPVNVETQSYARGAEIHRRSYSLPRDFTITGRIMACDWPTLNAKRQAFVDLHRPNQTKAGEQLILRYQSADNCGYPLGAPLEVVCAYKAGLEGNITNLYQESIGIQFHASQPMPTEVYDSAANLTGMYTTTKSNGILYRDTNGLWQNCGSGDTTGLITCVDFDTDGALVAAGDFTQLSGDAVVRIAKWDAYNVTWQGMGALPEDVLALDTGAPYRYEPAVGLVYEATLKGIATYDENTVTWSRVDTGVNANVVDVARAANDDLFIAGTFTDNGLGTDPNMSLVAWYKAADNLLYPMGRGIDPGGGMSVFCILPTNDGYVYVGGYFGTAIDGDGTTHSGAHVARYDTRTDTWDMLDGGLINAVHQLRQGPDGFVYAYGTFNRSDAGVYMYHVARWNGTAWEPVADQIDEEAALGLNYNAAAFDDTGTLWIGADGTASTDYLGVAAPVGKHLMLGLRNRVVYSPPYFQRDAGLTAYGIKDIACGPGGQMAIALAESANTNTIAVEKQTIITYAGNADAPVVLVMEGLVAVQYILNLDTEGGVYFNTDDDIAGFTIGANEQIWIRTDPQRPMVYSNGRPNLFKAIASGASNLLALRLRPGTNRFAILGNPDLCGPSDRDTWIMWRNTFQSVDIQPSL